MIVESVNSQKIRKLICFGLIFLFAGMQFPIGTEAFSCYTSGRDFRKSGPCYESAFYRRTTEQGRCHCPDENHAGALSETGDKDPDPRRKNKGTGIPECDAF